MYANNNNKKVYRVASGNKIANYFNFNVCEKFIHRNQFIPSFQIDKFSSILISENFWMNKSIRKEIEIENFGDVDLV